MLSIKLVISLSPEQTKDVGNFREATYPQLPTSKTTNSKAFEEQLFTLSNY